MIPTILSALFPPKPGKMTRDEVGNTLRLHALRQGLLAVYKAGPPEAGVLSFREWTNGRWRDRVRRFS